ncbi:MAG: hypothetical protein KGO49_08160 [Gammaproteobacteria bacterium]|jgi:hypothetical protein|nr:hypothetical protein [Gammaproteobacteria bacterium]
MRTQNPLQTRMSSLAERWAREIIGELEIQSGYGLAFYLDVDLALDNHRAVRAWLQRAIDRYVEDQDLFDQIKRELRRAFP